MSGQIFKSLLNQYCQKSRVSLPVYSTKPVQTIPGTPSYVCEVKLFNGASFESQGTFTNKKSAEQNAAEHALVALGQIAGSGVQNNSNSVTETCSVSESIQTAEMCSSTNNTAINSNDTVTIATPSGEMSLSPAQTVGQPAEQAIFPKLSIAKNILNERAQKLHVPLPSYQTVADSQGAGFISRVTFNGVTYCSNGSFRVKKEAEKSAAQEALKALLLQDGEQGCGKVTSVVESKRPEYCDLEQNKNTEPNVSCATQKNVGIAKVTPCNQEIKYIHGSSSSDMYLPGPSSSGFCASAEMPSTPAGTVNQPTPVSFKNLLQEYMQQRGIITGPKYETSLAGL